jgi:hypothetical protein
LWKVLMMTLSSDFVVLRQPFFRPRFCFGALKLCTALYTAPTEKPTSPAMVS